MLEKVGVYLPWVLCELACGHLFVFAPRYLKVSSKETGLQSQSYHLVSYAEAISSDQPVLHTCKLLEKSDESTKKHMVPREVLNVWTYMSIYIQLITYLKTCIAGKNNIINELKQGGVIIEDFICLFFPLHYKLFSVNESLGILLILTSHCFTVSVFCDPWTFLWS